jgi:hypothetical protein
MNTPISSRQPGVAVALSLLVFFFSFQMVGATERDQAFFDDPRSHHVREFQLDSRLLKSDFGQRSEISAVPLPGHRARVSLEMTRFKVFAEDARIVVHAPDGEYLLPIPKNVYFRGRVADEPGSTAVMTVLEGGEVRGLVLSSGKHWVISGDAINKSLPSVLRIREVEPTVELEHKAQDFECGTDRLQKLPEIEPSVDSATLPRVNTKSVSYTAKIAVETDNEFYALFGNDTDATNFVADIIAFGSTIYSAEVSTSWLLQDLTLWQTGVTDPWVQTDAECGLYEFGKYWNDNKTGVTRTIAHFMSGKNTYGIAWVGVLCYPALSYTQSCPGLPATSNYAGGYGFSGDLSGSFDFDNPAVVWDIISVTHEIGHNFNSPHTHCYADIGGNSSPIDECYSSECGWPGCHCGGTSLPSGCPGQGQGCGTIMSYCHLQGGMGNMSFSLGQGHPYGVAPDRVPSRMAAHVATQAALYPGCLEYVAVNDIFVDGFESGDTTAWSD